MTDYKKMYHAMLNSVTDAERKLQDAVDILQSVRLECEDMFMENGASLKGDKKESPRGHEVFIR